MKNLVIKVGDMEYPGHGNPCNGCGLCCLSALCMVASAVFSGEMVVRDEMEGPCPALEREGDRYYCGFMRSPAQYRPVQAAMFGEPALIAAMKYLMGAGRGCDLEFPGTPINEEYRRSTDEREQRVDVTATHAAAVWGFVMFRR